MADTETFQHYQVLKRPDGALWELGRGAMGVTYKAFDTSLRCHVALKVINTAFLDSETARQRFLREARAAAGLSHHNVASVFHLGEEGGNYFYAMEFIDGETLEAFVRREGSLPPALALRLTLQVTRALRAASRVGLVHRDIKPANLMLLREDDGESGNEGDEDEIHVKVIDFGLAKVARKDGSEASATITVAGFVGTPHFASPEQLEEKDLDVRSDIYSLGITLWYMLTGRPPFGGSMVQIMSQHLTRPPSFAQLGDDMPPEVVRLLEHMLEKDPAKRPQTATDLRREIEAALRTLRVGRAGGAPQTGSGDAPAAPTNAPLDSSFPTLAQPDADSLTGSHASQPAVEPATGVVFAGHYRLLRTVAEGARGTLFQALELDHGRPVALKILPAGQLASPDAFHQAEDAVARARAVPHPSLLEVFSLEQTDAHTFLTCEWVNGFRLVDLLRYRHSLPLGECLRCLDPLAAAADHARKTGLRDLEFGPGQVLLAFEAALDLPAQTALINTPLAQWPVFNPKVYPVSFDQFGVQPDPTWAGLQTMVPAAGPPPGALHQLALLAYELLGGSPSSPSTGAHRPPLAALTERGNTILREAMSEAQPSSFGSAAEFMAALRESAMATDRPDSGVGWTRPQGRAASVALSPSPLPLVAPVVSPPPLPLASSIALPSAPAPGPVAPPPGGGRRPLLLVVMLLLGLIALGIAGGASYAAWKIYASTGERTASDRHSGRAHASPADSSSVPATPLPTAAPTVAMVTPTPFPQATPVATPDRAARVREMLAEADTLERNGDVAGALRAYARLAEDYPDADPGLSRLDSFVGRLRSQSPAAETEPSRASSLRAPMEEAAKLGSDTAMLYLGEHLQKTDPAAAAEWYRQAAEKGQPEAMLALGDMYFRGVGVAQEPSQAARWYQLASDKGYPKAKLYLAECYELGKAGLPRDFDKSFQLLNDALALDPNNAAATEKLAEEYERGRGTHPDPFRAFSLMKRAVDLGSTPALGNLGVYYMKGYGQKANPAQAAALFKQGVERNHAPCMFFYAQCLEDGLGVPKNPGEAISYYRASAERGFPPARDWCNQHRVSFVPNERPTL